MELYDNGLKQMEKMYPRLKLQPNIYASYKTVIFHLLEQSGHRVGGDHVPDAPHAHIANGDSRWAKSQLLLQEGVQNLPNIQSSQAFAPFLGGGRSMQSFAVWRQIMTNLVRIDIKSTMCLSLNLKLPFGIEVRIILNIKLTLRWCILNSRASGNLRLFYFQLMVAACVILWVCRLADQRYD